MLRGALIVVIEEHSFDTDLAEISVMDNMRQRLVIQHRHRTEEELVRTAALLLPEYLQLNALNANELAEKISS